MSQKAYSFQVLANNFLKAIVQFLLLFFFLLLWFWFISLVFV